MTSKLTPEELNLLNAPLPPADNCDALGGLPLLPFHERAVVKIHRENCYICRDPDFRLYGLPLCKQCPECKGHIAADDSICDDCGYEEPGAPDEKPSQGVKCLECNSWTWSWVSACRNCRAELPGWDRFTIQINGGVTT